MMTSKSRRFHHFRTAPKGGFTLVEIMAATTVLVIGAIALFALLVIAIQTDSEGARYSIARSVAQQQFEYVRSMSPTTVASLPATQNLPITGSQPISNQLSLLPSGSGTLTVTKLSSGSQSGLYRVTVSISWTEPGRGHNSVAMDTYVTDQGINTL